MAQFTALRMMFWLPATARKPVLVTKSVEPNTTSRPLGTLLGRLSRGYARSEATMRPSRFLGSTWGRPLTSTPALYSGIREKLKLRSPHAEAEVAASVVTIRPPGARGEGRTL